MGAADADRGAFASFADDGGDDGGEGGERRRVRDGGDVVPVGRDGEGGEELSKDREGRV